MSGRYLFRFIPFFEFDDQRSCIFGSSVDDGVRAIRNDPFAHRSFGVGAYDRRDEDRFWTEVEGAGGGPTTSAAAARGITTSAVGAAGGFGAGVEEGREGVF